MEAKELKRMEQNLKWRMDLSTWVDDHTDIELTPLERKELQRISQPNAKIRMDSKDTAILAAVAYFGVYFECKVVIATSTLKRLEDLWEEVIKNIPAAAWEHTRWSSVDRTSRCIKKAKEPFALLIGKVVDKPESLQGLHCTPRILFIIDGIQEINKEYLQVLPAYKGLSDCRMIFI